MQLISYQKLNYTGSRKSFALYGSQNSYIHPSNSDEAHSVVHNMGIDHDMTQPVQQKINE